VLLKSLQLMLLARDDHDLGLYVTDLFLQATQLGGLCRATCRCFLDAEGKVLVRVCEHGGLGLVVDLVLGLSLVFNWCKATGRNVVE
jgi:hypothetical protein